METKPTTRKSFTPGKRVCIVFESQGGYGRVKFAGTIVSEPGVDMKISVLISQVLHAGKYIPTQVPMLVKAWVPGNGKRLDGNLRSGHYYVS